MVLLDATLGGVGVSLQPKHAVEPYLLDGRLIQLLPEYKPMTFGIYGVYRSRKHMPMALRTFLDELVEYFADLDM